MYHSTGEGGREGGYLPLHACIWRGRGRGGDGRDSFITFNAEPTNICLFNKFFFNESCYEYNMCTYIHIIRCKEELVDFLIKHGVLTSTITCDKCSNDLNFVHSMYRKITKTHVHVTAAHERVTTFSRYDTFPK